jgi:transcriptional regulator with XRE-family HTH domain
MPKKKTDAAHSPDLSFDDFHPSPAARQVYQDTSAAIAAGRLIKSWRKQAAGSDGSQGFTQGELAERIGVSQARISEIETGNGRDGPSFALLARIAHACGIDLLARLQDADAKPLAKAKSKIIGPRVLADKIAAGQKSRKKISDAVPTLTAAEPIPIKKITRRSGQLRAKT